MKYRLGKKRKFKMPIKSELIKEKYREVQGYLVTGHSIPNLTIFAYIDGNHEWYTCEYHTGMKISFMRGFKTPEEVIEYTLEKLSNIPEEEQKESLQKVFRENPKINRGGIGYRELAMQNN